MNGPAIVCAILRSVSAVTTLVPDASIECGLVGVDDPKPAIGVSEVSEVERITISMSEGTQLMQSRVQVCAITEDYADTKAALAESRLALRGRNGQTWAGVKIDSIVPAGKGSDDENPDRVIYIQTRDFIVRFLLPAS